MEIYTKEIIWKAKKNIEIYCGILYSQKSETTKVSNSQGQRGG